MPVRHGSVRRDRPAAPVGARAPACLAGAGDVPVTTAAPPRTARPGPRAPVPPATGPPVTTAVVAAAAVLLAGTPVAAVVQGTRWVGYAAAAVALVLAVGLVLGRSPAAVVPPAQVLGLTGLLTVLFSGAGVLGVLPGPGALAELGALLGGAGAQIDTGIPPVPATPEILFLVTLAFGLLAVLVHGLAVLAGAPAAAGVPLLAVFAVPTALADELLPWWSVLAAAAGFGALLLVRGGSVKLLPGGATVTVAAVVLALLVGASATMVGTGGRFGTGTGGSGAGGAIGLSPFTALRGQLEQTTPGELFHVRGLPQPSYLRALTLREYVPGEGWQAGAPEPGVAISGPLAADPVPPGEQVTVDVENQGFRDYWLPVYGDPVTVTGLPPQTWAYDGRSGIAYTSRPRQEDSWQQQAVLPAPTADQLRAAEGAAGAGAEYLSVDGVDPRVAEIAAEVTRDRETGFDKTMALVDYFAGPDSTFGYSLQTAPSAGDDPLVEFLTVGRIGYCEQFASAMAVMLRTVGVPARVAVGFTGGTDSGRYRSVTTADAHAWVEAWFPGVGWTTFDPTPLVDGRTLVPSYVEEARGRPGGGAELPVPEALGPDDLPAGDPLGQPEPVGPAEPETAAPDTTGSVRSGWPLTAALVVARGLVVAGATPAVVRAGQRRRRLAAAHAGGPRAAGAAWAEVLADSADRGGGGGPAETVRDTARRLVREHRLDGDAQQALRGVVGSVERSWYGDEHPQPGELDEPLHTLRAAVADGSPLSVRAGLMPRSVLDRRRPGDRPQRGAATDTAGTDRAAGAAERSGR
jgi:hypothetical protein